MGLVKLSEYNGSKVAELVNNMLIITDMMGYIRSIDYQVYVYGAQSPTPDGMIEDAPDKHRIEFRRNKYIGSALRYGFFNKVTGEIDNNSPEYRELLSEYSKDNFPVHLKMGQFNASTSRVQLVKGNELWFEHVIVIIKDRDPGETDDDYAFRITKTIQELITG